MSSPPRLAVWLLRTLLPAPLDEAMVGDLEEQFRTRIHLARGSRAARWWFWRQTLAALPLARLRAPRLSHAPRPRDGIMISFLNELRLSARRLRRAPGFTAVACITLMLGIGATTAIFSVVNPILFESLPYPAAGRLMAIGESAEDGSLSNTGFATFADLRRDSRLLEGVAAMSYWTPILGGNAEPERVQGQSVSSEFFRVLGVAPALGRSFLAEEDVPERNRVVVLSHGLWQRRFGADSSLIGRTIDVSGMPYTVVGVMPRSFESLLAPAAVIWRPLGYDQSFRWSCRTCRHLRVVGRVRPGVGRAELDRELDGLIAGYERDFPTQYAHAGTVVEQLQDRLVSPVRGAMLLLLVAVGLVLVMAATNVANLGLGRAVQRESEFAVRAALGGGRRHLIRQLVAENVLLAALGGLGGLGLAWLGVRALVGLAPEELPRLSAIRLDLEVLLFTAATVLAAGFAIGIVPAFTLARADLFSSIRSGSVAPTAPAARRVLRRGLVVVEIALALTLMTGAGLLIRSVQRLLGVETGFAPGGLLTLTFQASTPAYGEDAAVHAVQQRVLEAVRAIPGARSVALASQIPLGGNFDAYLVMAQDKPLANPELAPSGQRYTVSAEYLRTMGIPLRRGRLFEPADRDSAPPVALVNEELARQIWPGEDPVGKRIRVDEPWREVVGVVGNTHHMSLDTGAPPQFYVPLTQWRADNTIIVVIRTTGDIPALIRAVRAAIRGVDPALAISDVAAMEDRVTRSAGQRRFAMLLFQCFALVALLLAATGLFGVLSGRVTERRRELGIRSALGATGRRLLAMVLGEGLALAAVGLVAGLAGTLALSRLLRGLLFGVSPYDPVTMGTMAVLLLAVAAAACLAPAWRAARADPVATLKSG